ncbi:MAG: hypothetical protein AB7J35_06425 [Dehalococcoidia bacterium]
MKRLFGLALMAVAVALLSTAPAAAENSVQLSKATAIIGEHIGMEIRLTAPADATIELTPGTPSWADVELVGVEEMTRVEQGGEASWFIRATVAPFSPGTVDFAPSVAIVQGPEATQLELPATRLSVSPTLPADAELVLSPLPPPVAVAGAESVLLRPAIVVAGVLAAALIALAIWFLGRQVIRLLRKPAVNAPAEPVPVTLDGAERLLDADPVGAYRLMSTVVKSELARRYGVRATALTSTELRRKLEEGSDRWEARLVGGLLEECDSVIYAGYRPAPERRQADLTMAREIVEVAN